MSKFWGADDESSESSSSSSESEQEAVQQRPRVMQRWAEASSSEDEDTQKRVVRSQKDKRFDELRNAVKQLRNHMKVNDFQNVVTDYETLFKGLKKAQASKGVSDDDGTPRIFIRAITELETYIETVFAQGTKSLKENKAKAFNTLRSKVRKGNKDYAQQVEQCKSNPSAYESAGEEEEEAEEEDESSSDSSEESSSDSSDSSDSDDDDGDSAGSSSWEEDQDEELDGDLDEATLRERKLMKWLIDSDDEDEEEARKRKKDEKEAKRLEASKKKEQSRAAKVGQTSGEAEGDGIADDMKLEDVQKKIKELAQLRGRKGVDKHDMFRQFEGLLRVSEKFGAVEPLTILTLFISAEFDQTTGAFQAMHLPTWTTVLLHCKKMLELLYSDPQAAARNLNSDEVEVEEEADEDEEDEEEDERPAPPPPATNARSQTVSSLTAFLEKLDDELFKALQLTDVHTAQYQERLGASVNLITLLKNAVQFHKESKAEDGGFRHKGDLSRLALRLVEHLYYKHDDVNIAVRDAVLRAEPLTPQETEAWKRDPSEEIYEYCTFIHAHGQMREKLRAVLCQTYHHALHGRFYHARDLMQLSGVQESVQNADILTLILFNRALVMVGLAAFRLGKLQDALYSLMEVCAMNRAKELLAQGLALRQERTPEQEKQERRRQMPYHMHISLDVVESAHYICAMLLEVPNMAQNPFDSNRNVISKSFRRQLEQYDRNMFAGSENSRESVMAAARALLQGNWQRSIDHLGELKIWSVLQDAATVKPMIERMVRIEGMRTYLFQYSGYYHSFSVEQLSLMFDIDQKTVRSTVSKMLIAQELHACWDEDSTCLHVHHVEPTRLQYLALQLAERTAMAIESNERMLEQKTGGSLDRWDSKATNRDRWDNPKGKGAGKGMRGGRGLKGAGKGNLRQRPATLAKRGWENARAGARQVGRSIAGSGAGGDGGPDGRPGGGGVFRSRYGGGGGFTASLMAGGR